ncbi:MAG: hypothetical protein Q4E75_03990 [bacterium]|nr:hypothetical protein [bacterium]
MKKKVLFILIVISFMVFIPNAFAADDKIIVTKGCVDVFENASVVIDPKIPNLVHTVILAIQIAVPVVLVIFGMLDFFKGVTSGKEDEIKKNQTLFIKRLISAVLIFFIVAIVKLLFSLVADDKSGSKINCVNCFLNGVNSDGNCKRQ